MIIKYLYVSVSNKKLYKLIINILIIDKLSLIKISFIILLKLSMMMLIFKFTMPKIIKESVKNLRIQIVKLIKETLNIMTQQESTSVVKETIQFQDNLEIKEQ
jgi:hypothetical protein